MELPLLSAFDGSREAGRQTPLWPFLALAAVSPLLFMLPITHDAAFQMWAGRQMYFGVDLYSEIVEVNPPLWFWMAVPLSGLAAILHFRSIAVLIAAFILAIAFSLYLCTRLYRGNFLFYAAFLLAALPIQNFGQREHFALLAAIPYVLLIARRESGEETSLRLAIVVGIFGAFGFALKPYFALVPIALELWLRRNPLRPETIAVGLAAISYAVAIIVFEPDYFSIALPLAVDAYGTYGQLTAALLLPTLVPFVLAVFLRYRGAAAAFMIAALIFYLIFVMQMKGWAYQFIPASGMLLLAVATSQRERLPVFIALPFAAAFLALVPNLTPYDNPPWVDVPNGTSFAALSMSARAGWPMVEERNLKWPLPYMAPWMAPVLGLQTHDQLIHDLSCNPPALLLVDDRQFNFSKFVPEALSHYSTARDLSGVKLMTLVSPFKRPRRCRPIY